MAKSVLEQITVLSGKGGTGKTTISSALAQLSSPTSLMADCDVDAPNLHLLLNPKNLSSEQFFSGKLAIKNQDRCINCGKCLDLCRFDAISINYEINHSSCEGCGACAWICPEEAISMEIQLCGEIYEAETRFGPMVHARLKIGAENSGKLVSEVIQKSHIKANQLKKKLIIVDGSPGIGCPVIAALTNAKLVIIVVEPTKTAVHDMKRIIGLIRFFKLPLAIIINKSTINRTQRSNIINFCENEKISILGELPYNLEIFKAMTNRKTVIEYKVNGLEVLLTDIWLKIRELIHLE
ncbi:MAG: ATP-binding protein [Candidatus Hodarchaeota archaeon]